MVLPVDQIDSFLLPALNRFHAAHKRFAGMIPLPNRKPDNNRRKRISPEYQVFMMPFIAIMDVFSLKQKALKEQIN
jgi:hypothetical protein